jgi:hypothetical protein
MTSVALIRLHSFVLIDANEISGRVGKGRMFYPAQIVTRQDDIVHLEWHRDIDWPEKAPVVVPSFALTPQKCYSARNQDLMLELGASLLGTGTVHIHFIFCKYI